MLVFRIRDKLKSEKCENRVAINCIYYIIILIEYFGKIGLGDAESILEEINGYYEQEVLFKWKTKERTII